MELLLPLAVLAVLTIRLVKSERGSPRFLQKSNEHASFDPC
jgi:hypothetical protein